MAVTFDEILLDDAYSAIADGGPEFSTAMIRSGPGGGISSRAETREDYVSKYEISYAELTDDRRSDLRRFAILRKGMARGFRFNPPDDRTMTDEVIGWFNPASGEVERLASTNGTHDTFYLLKHYEDAGNNYTRRIVKPSPYEEVRLHLDDGIDFAIIAVIPANTAIVGGVIQEIANVTNGVYDFEFNFFTGAFEIDPAPPNASVITATCSYHLPATFTEDWLRFKVDESAISEFKIGIEELLPIEIGIT